MELPQYSVKPSVSRILFPQFFKLAALCALFYGGVWINFFLLRQNFPLWITMALVIILAILFVVQLQLTKAQANKYHYDFFSNRVEFYGDKLKSAMFSNVQEIKTSRNFFDSISGTGTIILSKDFRISNVSNYAEIQNYLNQLIQNFRQSSAQEAGAYT